MGEAKDENNKPARRRKWNYHLMLLADNVKGEFKQIGIDRIFVEILAAIVVIALAVTITGWVVSSNKYEKEAQVTAELTAQNESLNGQIEELTAENDELNNKVSILSDTVNAKVEQENSAQQESDEAHMPEGFPLTAAASMTTDENDSNTLIFTHSEGASIIATGAGTVTEVSPDADYGYLVKIDHGNGYVTEYYGASEPLVKKGDEVITGSILAMVENKDSKVAYRVYKDDQPIDPTTIIKIDG